MKDRLQELLKKEQLSPVRFAELVGVQRSSVSHILSGRNNPSLDFIQKILLKMPHISTDWLITGKGSMYKNSISTRSVTPDIFSSSKSEEQTKENINMTNSETIINEHNDGQTLTHPVNTKINHPEIERIVVFYTDKTFREYKPE